MRNVSAKIFANMHIFTEVLKELRHGLCILKKLA